VLLYIQKYIILQAVLYGCETWSLKPWEEHRSRVFENRMLRRLFGPSRKEVAGGWRRMYIEEHHQILLGGTEART
jgi:hypothetical protein